MTLCRDGEGGVDWAKQREEVDSKIAEVANQLTIDELPLDPETWGTAPEQVAATERLLRKAPPER